MGSEPAANRRMFLKNAGAAVTGLAVAGTPPVIAASYPDAQMQNTLPTMQFGPYTISKLVLGSNTFGGYMHYVGQYAALVREYYTDDNIVKCFHRAHEEGVNLLQGHTDDQMVRNLLKFRESGKTLHWMFVMNEYEESTGRGAYRISLKNPEVQEAIRLCKPIALIHHGEQTDDLFKQGKQAFERVNDAFKRIADMGMIPGMSTHLPETITYVEDKGWDCRFYMGCFYRCGKVKPDEWKAKTGVTPIGEFYTEEMPDVTCNVLRQVNKPCFGYKILAAGRKAGTSAQVEDCYRYAFQNLKKTDGIIVGVFQKFQDQVKIAADLTRKLAV